MQNAFEDGFQAGFERIIIIGSDLYDISEADISEAFRKLQHKDAVIGPAIDGGFYLLGLTYMIPQLFQDKEWGTSSVLKDTLEDLKDIEGIDVFKPFLKVAKNND